MATEEATALWCAQCEDAPATLECFDEELLYCASCSASLHSKRARLHHCVKPFRLCDECERTVARVKCVRCSGKEGAPLVFCAECSALLHAKRARKDHHLEALYIAAAGDMPAKGGAEEIRVHHEATTQIAASLSSAKVTTSSVTDAGAAVVSNQLPGEIAHTAVSTTTTNFAIDRFHGNDGHCCDAPSSCHFCHRCFPGYCPHPAVFFAKCTSHGSSEHMEPCMPRCKADGVAVFKSKGKDVNYEQPERNGSCCKKRSRHSLIDTSPEFREGSLYSELSSECPSKKLHNVLTEVQGSESEKDLNEIDGIALIEGLADNEPRILSMEGSGKLPPDILHNRYISEDNDASKNAIEEERVSDRGEQSCIKVPEGEIVSEKEITCNSYGKALHNVGSGSMSGCNQVILEGTPGEYPHSEAFCELVSATDMSSGVFEKYCEKKFVDADALLADFSVKKAHVGELYSERLSDMLPSVLLNETVVEKVSTEDAPAISPPSMMRAPKEEPIDTLEQACKGSPEMSLGEKIPNDYLTNVSLEESPVSTSHEYTRRSKFYWLRNLPVAKQEAVSEEEKDSEDGFEQSHSEGDTTNHGIPFNTKNFHRGSVTLEAVVKYTVDYDTPYSITGKIVGILEHGLVSSNSDADARRAVKEAQRRLTKYNLKQACTSKGGLQNTQTFSAGLCVVEFVSTGLYQRSLLDGWTYNLAHITAKYFSTDYCAQRLKVIFYGIEQNASCAGHAFAATFNRVTNLSADFVPEKLLDEDDAIDLGRIGQCRSKSVFSRKSRMAYRKDLVDALYHISESSRWQQEDRTKLPAFVGASANWIHNGGESFVPVCSARSIWLEGVPKNKALVKKYGYEAVKALVFHSRKVCMAFLEIKKWTVVGSKLKDPVLA